jgi:hypothetical protein
VSPEQAEGYAAGECDRLIGQGAKELEAWGDGKAAALLQLMLEAD